MEKVKRENGKQSQRTSFKKTDKIKEKRKSIMLNNENKNVMSCEMLIKKKSDRTVQQQQSCQNKTLIAM